MERSGVLRRARRWPSLHAAEDESATNGDRRCRHPIAPCAHRQAFRIRPRGIAIKRCHGFGFCHDTHLDVPPPFFADLQEPLRSYVEAETKAPGVNSVEILQHVAPRQNHLTMLEAWGSRADLDTQRSGSASIEFRNKIVPLLGALYDERLYRAVD